MEQRGACGVLITGVYGSGKSSVAEEIAYLLEQRGEPYTLLDLDLYRFKTCRMVPDLVFRDSAKRPGSTR